MNIARPQRRLVNFREFISPRNKVKNRTCLERGSVLLLSEIGYHLIVTNSSSIDAFSFRLDRPSALL